MFNEAHSTGHESWSGKYKDFNNDISLLLARIVSDICAPGFFFTMGLGMTLLFLSRRKKQWSDKKILTFFLKRGLFMIVLERFADFGFSLTSVMSLIEGKVVPNGFSGKNSDFFDTFSFILLTFTVLSILGISMVLNSLLLIPLGKTKLLPKHKFLVCLVLSLLSFLLSNLIIVHYQHGDPEVQSDVFPGSLAEVHSIPQFFIRLFFLPGPAIYGSYNVYPVFPWVGLTCLGIGCGFLVEENSSLFFSKLKYCGIGLLGLFFVVRTFGGSFGNLRGWPRGDGKEEGISFFIEYFSTLKYPPSLAYALWTTGVNFILLSLFSNESVGKLLENDDLSQTTLSTRTKTYFLKLCQALGTSPLFFYVAHLYMISIFAIISSFIFYSDKSGKFKVESLLLLLPYWFLTLLVFYPLCKRYSEFKRKTGPESLWRYM